MSLVHIQNQEQQNLIPNSPITHKQKSIIIPLSSSSSLLDQQVTNDFSLSLLDQQVNNDFISKLHLNNTSTSTRHHRHRNSTKRRSPSSSSISEQQRSAKKHSFDQDNGFSAISLPISLCGNAHVLRRCVSDVCQLPEQSTPVRENKSGLPPLPPKLRRCMSADVESVSRSLNSEDNRADSMRLKRMKDRLKEMKQWWDDVMKEEEEEEEEEGIKEEEEQDEEEQEEEKEQSPVVEEDKVLSELKITNPQSPVAEEDKVISQDEFAEDFEEAVSVEWAEKCLSLTFKCPCSKAYEVLISENKCYYKLV